MGMELYGLRPNSVEGERFSISVYAWESVYVRILATGVLSDEELESLGNAKGHHVDEDQALTIADNLETMMPDFPDEYEVNKLANVHLREFIKFCRESGGFEVW